MRLLATMLPKNNSIFQGIVAVLIVAFVTSVLFPLPARGQLGLGLAGLVRALQAIYDILRDEIGKILGEIRTFKQWSKDYFELILFPKEAIDAARALAKLMKDTFNALIVQALSRSVQSATLPAPQQLESLMRSAGLDPNQVGPVYRNVYGSVPIAGDASPMDRALIDVDDALALSSLKNLATHESAVGLALTVASEIEERIREPESAPGGAPFLSAAGIAAAIQTQAMIQKMVAAQLRQEAALLAHRNTLLKRDVALTAKMKATISNLLGKDEGR